MTEQDIKQEIVQVLSDWQDTQLNIKSDHARDLLAEALVQRLIRTRSMEIIDDG